MAKIIEFDTCANRNHYLVHDNVSIVLDKDGAEHIDWYWTTLRRMNTMQRFVVIIHRCKKGGTACEYFTTWEWSTALCTFVVAKNALWSPVIESTTPPIKCPLEPARHHTTNGALNLSMLDAMGKASGLDQYVWRSEAQMWDDTKHLILCNKLAFEIRRIAIRPLAPHADGSS